VTIGRGLHDQIVQAFVSGKAAAVKKLIGDLRAARSAPGDLRTARSAPAELQGGSSDYFLEPEALVHLKTHAPDAYKELDARLWPPTGWKGADKDAAMALKLAELLEGAVESSDIDCSFFAFVLGPGEGDEPDEDDDDDSEDEVFLAMIDEDERERCVEEHGEKTWWREYWQAEEYKARTKAGAFMSKSLKGVWRDEMSLGPVSSLVFYQGRSKTGATVGVLVTRTDT
jgi:hypothetical protein